MGIQWYLKVLNNEESIFPRGNETIDEARSADKTGKPMEYRYY